MVGIILSICLLGIDANPSAGSSGYSFLNINPCAQTAAMANTVISLQTNYSINALSLLNQPAGIIKKNNLSASYINYLAGISIGAIGYAQTKPLSFLSSGGISLNYLNSGTIKRTDETGAELGTFSVSYVNLNAIGTKSLLSEQLSVGGNLKLSYGSIDSFWGVATALDFGAIYKPQIPNLSIGLLIKNLGLSIKAFEQTHDRLPLDIGIGACYRANENIALALDIHKPLDNTFLFNFGIEAWLNNFIALRSGYNSLGKYYKSGGFSNLTSGLSAGLGVKYSKYQLDYGFTPMGALGMLHHLTLSLIL